MSAAGQCFGPIIVAPVHFVAFFHFGKTDKLIGYADNSSLMAVVPSPGVRVTAANSMIRDLGRVSE